MPEEAVANEAEATETAPESTEGQEPVNEEVSRFTEVLEEQYGKGDVEDDSDADAAESDQDVEEDSVPEIDEALKAQAAEYGLSEEDLATFGDKAPEMVKKFVESMDRQIAELGKLKLEAKTEDAKDDAPQDEAPEDTDAPDILAILKDDGFDEDDAVYKAVAAMQGQLDKAMSALTQQPQAQTEQFDNSLASELDNLFGSLGDEYKGLLGEGSIWEYKPGSKEHDFVNEVFEQMSALDAGYQAQGKDLGTKDLFNKAMALASHDHLKEITRKEILGKVKKQSDSAMTAPAKKGTAEAIAGLSKEDAISNIASVMRETGFTDL